MKVCMLAEKLPPEFSGSGRQAVSLARALKLKGVETIGLCSNPNGESDMDVTWGFPICRLRTSAEERVRSLEFAIKSIIWLLKNRHGYDILHVHGYCISGLVGSIVAKALGKKTIYKVTLPGEDDPKAIFESRFGRVKSWLLKYYDALVSISDRVQQHAEDFGYPSIKVFSVPNGVDPKFYADETARMEAKTTLLTRYGFNKNTRIISYVGSIEYRKGLDILARAWHRIVSQAPESRLLMVGPFFEQTNFHQQLVSLIGEHLGRTVFLVGNVSDPERYYRASDVFVFPSRNESFGNVVTEAMACGVACVAVHIKGVTKNIITNGYDGLIVEPEDPEGLGDAILSVLREPEVKTRLTRNAAKTIDENFRIDAIADKYVDLYKRLLGESLRCSWKVRRP